MQTHRPGQNSKKPGKGAAIHRAEDWEEGRTLLLQTGLWDSGMESENTALQENSRSVLGQASYNCSLPSSGCGDANRLMGSPGTG